MFRKSVTAFLYTPFVLLLLATLPTSSFAQSIQATSESGIWQTTTRQGCDGVFIESNGLAIMEIESADLSDDWSFRTDIPGYTGSGYYEWKHGNSNNVIDSPGGGILTYSVQISKTGTYRFLYRTAAPDPTDHNDSWIRFRDNEVEARTDDGDVIDLGQDQWFKVYHAKGNDEWNHAAHTDEGPHQIYALINTPGVYRLEVSGRSTLFKMDRLSIYHFDTVSYGTATNINTPESTCLLPVELTSFEGLVNGNDVVLNWETASELNNAGFDIEFSNSADGQFSKVGFVSGQGTTDEVSRYQFSHAYTGFEGQQVSYRLKQLDFDGAFEYSDVVTIQLPAAATAKLHQAYPNPFNPSTTISFSIPTESPVTLNVFDAMGRQVQTLVDGILPAGYHTRQFEAIGMANGTYLYRLETPSQTLSGTVMLLK